MQLIYCNFRPARSARLSQRHTWLCESFRLQPITISITIHGLGARHNRLLNQLLSRRTHNARILLNFMGKTLLEGSYTFVLFLLE